MQSTPDQDPSRFDWLMPAALGVLTLLFMAAAWAGVGGTLGLLFAGIGVMAVLLPTASADVRGVAHLLLRPLIAVVILAGFWLTLIAAGGMTLGQWTACVLVAAAFALALSGLTGLLARGMDSSVASTLVTLAALAWLSWPIWLSAALTGSHGETLVAWLVPAHPLFAINGQTVDRLGVWTQQPLMYDRLTPLGQDVLYVLPRNVWPCVLFHGSLALAAIVIGSHGPAARVRRKDGTRIDTNSHE